MIKYGCCLVILLADLLNISDILELFGFHVLLMYMGVNTMQSIVKHQAVEAPEKFFANYYHVFYRAAMQYIRDIPFYPGETVLDVGCRNGKVTELLGRFNPDVHFKAITTTKDYLGVIDNDNSLIHLPNVQFQVQLLDDYVADHCFDKVVSFSCLTWYQDKAKVVAKIYQALKPGKKAYLQFFLDHGQDWFDRCIFAVANLESWQPYFKNFAKKVQHIKPGDFLFQAEKIGFIIEKSSLKKRKIPVQDKNYLKNWMMTWSSHLAFLPQDKIDNFFAQAVEHYLSKQSADAQIYYEDFYFEVTLLKPL